ncbi:hypothetical protein ALC62_15346 [Cyphomyrmex costatus]|uniref:Integrase catalytic domain-containing protein n=1 Tax=Cyphomyrmex costatus TaxID=456900 RepID=A0A151I7A5_9HYME|nr:hypothetical protein ALC62_15346 [Cyphomyrmex costatus]
MRPYARLNKGCNYILTVIDVLSKYAWALPLKTKSYVKWLGMDISHSLWINKADCLTCKYIFRTNCLVLQYLQ